MAALYSDLSWLPPAPADFAAQCREALNHPTTLGQQLRVLATSALDENQLVRLAKTIGKARETGLSLAPLVPYRLGLISNATLDFLIPVLVASATRHGIALECVKGAYDQALQESLDPTSALYRSDLNAVLLAIDWRGLPLRSSPGQAEDAGNTINQSLDYLRLIRSGIQNHSRATCIFQTLAAPPETVFGSLDRTLPGAPRHVLDGVNRGIGEIARESGSAVLDAAGLAETVGLAHWHAPTEWNMAKIPFSQHLLPLYAEYVARLLASLAGKSRRCLVLDLDNTLWGGIIGDDGLKGICVAQGDASGESFLSFQRYALSLRDRGVVLAICSKNEDDTARQPFREHPDMLLREEHIAVFQANWTDKATNIQAIAEELTSGPGIACIRRRQPSNANQVRRALPEVGRARDARRPGLLCPHLALPDISRPRLFGRRPPTGGVTTTATPTRERCKAAGDIREISRVAGHGNHLPAFQRNRPRPHRPADQQVEPVQPDHAPVYRSRGGAPWRTIRPASRMQVRLTDTFGDNGMISVVICRDQPDEWEIDTWLMSCRVLGR